MAKIVGYWITNSSYAKPYGQEDTHNSWHYAHTKGTSVKGLNVLNCLYHSTTAKGAISSSVNYHLVEKPIQYFEIETKKEKRKTSKNQMIGQAFHNQLPFRYVLADSWLCSNGTMRYVHKKEKYFVFEIKTNPLACRDDTQRDQGQ